jgi:predicted RNA-binding protein with PUA-like domain
MAYWLFKTDPAIYSWEMLGKDKKTRWDGVRNYPSRNNLRAMQPGDLAFIYNGGDEQMVMGVARIAGAAYDDPASAEGNWSVIDVEAVMPLVRPISLDEIRYTYLLNVMPLVTQSRLTVQPVNEAQWNLILKIAKTEVPT